MPIRILGTDIPIEQIRDRLAELSERARVPHALNLVLPRAGSSHPQLKALGKKVWDLHDRAFPRHCKSCIHYDLAAGQDSIEGRTIETEEEALNIVAQRLLIKDYVWDVGGEEVRMDLKDLGACKKRDVYTFAAGSCEHFARTVGGALDTGPLEETSADGVTGWRKSPEVKDEKEESGRPVAHSDVDASEAEATSGEDSGRSVGGEGGAGDPGGSDQKAVEGGDRTN